MKDLEVFFESFDKNNNNNLEWTEASEYYNWIKRNIGYRYDDEYIIDARDIYQIGDGRPGDDYYQSAEETYFELAGDCEDHSELIAAFFRYWGYESKVGVLELDDTMYHAIAIVKVDDPIKIATIFGKMSVYSISSDESLYYGLTPGTYIPIDTLYGNKIGETNAPVKLLSYILDI